MKFNNDSLKNNKNKRTGDTIQIDGGYQWFASNSKNPIQKFWHYTKKSAIDTLCPPHENSVSIDVGCGSGVISNYINTKYNSKVFAIDGNYKAIEFGKNIYSNIEFIHSLVDDDFNLPEQPDYIFCLELIEHIYLNQAKSLLENFHRILKPGGKLFLTTPNYKSAWPLIEKIMDMLSIAPKLADSQHVHFYNPETLSELVMSSGFTVKTLRTNCFLAPWLSVLSRKFAEWLDKKELQIPWHVGSIIIIVAEKN